MFVNESRKAGRVLERAIECNINTICHNVVILSYPVTVTQYHAAQIERRVQTETS